MPKLDDFVLPIGKARIHRPGKDVTIVSWSIGMTYATKAAAELEKLGIDAEVIDLRSLRPLDTETIVASVMKTGRLVTVEEGWQQSGVGAEITARVVERAFDYLDAPPARVSGKDVPMPYAANLEKLALPSVAEVIEAVKSALMHRSLQAFWSKRCKPATFFKACHRSAGFASGENVAYVEIAVHVMTDGQTIVVAFRISWECRLSTIVDHRCCGP